MTYTSLLAVACGRPTDGPLLHTAARLAERFSATVKVVPAFVDPAAVLVGLGASLATPVSPAILDEIVRGEHEVMDAITSMAGAAAETASIPFGPGACGPRLEVAKPDVRPWFAVARALPLTDLVLFDRGAARGEGPAASVFGETLLAGRAPVLVTPQNGAPKFQRVSIAWDGGLEAGRAVRAAMPLLGAAEEVRILQATRGLSPQQRESPSSRPQALQHYLHCAGVQTTSIHEIQDEAEGPGLAAAVKTVEADLLVAGGYGHSRLRELVLGGATKSFVSMADGVAVFLTH